MDEGGIEAAVIRPPEWNPGRAGAGVARNMRLPGLSRSWDRSLGT